MKNDAFDEQRRHRSPGWCAAYPASAGWKKRLYSGGNMYLVRGDMPRAVAIYTRAGAQVFPKQHLCAVVALACGVAQLSVAPIPTQAAVTDGRADHVNYPARHREIPGALYWRGRLLRGGWSTTSAQAANYYRSLNASYVNSYYAMLGRQRLDVLGTAARRWPILPLRPLAPPSRPVDVPAPDGSSCRRTILT